MFVTVFHVWLNLLAELLRFVDRIFYKVGLLPLKRLVFIDLNPK